MLCSNLDDAILRYRSTVSCKGSIVKNYESYVLIEERTREEKERKREREIKVADYK